MERIESIRKLEPSNALLHTIFHRAGRLVAKYHICLNCPNCNTLPLPPPSCIVHWSNRIWLVT